MRRTLPIVFLLALAAGASADLDAAEKKWAQQCMDNLSSKSALVRSSAERAVSGLGIDALAFVVSASAKLKTDADWQSLTHAIGGMGPGAGKALDDLRASWPKGTEKRFADMVAALEKAEEEAKAKADAGVPPPPSPAAIEAEVFRIIEAVRGRRSVTAADPAVSRIVAMGHDAVGALLRFLEREPSQGDDFAARYSAQHALAPLAGPEDVSAIAALMRSGLRTVLPGLSNVDCPEATAVLVEAVAAGGIDRDLVDAVERRRAEPKIDAALIANLKTTSRFDSDVSRQFYVGMTAGILARHDAEAAAPVLVTVLPRLDQLQPRQMVASSLAKLGRKEGVAALIEILVEPEGQFDGKFDYPRHVAGLELDVIAGLPIYTGKEVEKGGMLGDPSKPSHTQYDADFREAYKAFREWWSKAKDAIHFDATSRAWSSN